MLACKLEASGAAAGPPWGPGRVDTLPAVRTPCRGFLAHHPCCPLSVLPVSTHRPCPAAHPVWLVMLS